MGEVADMVLDGILDWDGSYNESHRGYNYNVQSSKFYQSVNKVNNFLRSRGYKRIGSTSIKKRLSLSKVHVQEYNIVKKYNVTSYGKICMCICETQSTFNEFKRWIDNKKKNQ